MSMFKISPVEQRERPQRHSGRCVLEVAVTAALRIDTADAAQDGHVLFAVSLPCHRLADNAGRRLEAPQDLCRCRRRAPGTPPLRHR
jgi:hypothetical protein